jgi:hypothetical protein
MTGALYHWPLNNTVALVARRNRSRMKQISIRPTPYPAPSLPFANETELQEFVEKYAPKILGLTVIASARPGGRGLFRIDALAVDDANNPYIIEFKSNQVGSDAIQQLLRYREMFEADLTFFAQRLTDTNRHAPGKAQPPVLIAIGYRYMDSVLSDAEAQSITCLTYAYHDVTWEACSHVSSPFDVVEPLRRGEVSIHLANERPMPSSRHRRVCKRHVVIERLKALPELDTAFWEIDCSLRDLKTVTALYGKNPEASYHGPRGKFAEARMERKSKSIEWQYLQQGVWDDGRLGIQKMFRRSDKSKILDLLSHAYLVAC